MFMCDSMLYRTCETHILLIVLVLEETQTIQILLAMLLILLHY